MYAGFVAIIWKGCSDMGLEFIYTTALENGRLAFDDFSMDPRVRHSVLSTVFGSTFGVWLGKLLINNFSLINFFRRLRNESVEYSAISLLQVGKDCAKGDLDEFTGAHRH